VAEPVLLICAAYVVLDGLTIVLCGALKGCGRQMLQVEMVVGGVQVQQRG
jgi:Na+-driven multidrug efflux pump